LGTAGIPHLHTHTYIFEKIIVAFVELIQLTLFDCLFHVQEFLLFEREYSIFKMELQEELSS
jgi:hypothetical protein